MQCLGFEIYVITYQYPEATRNVGQTNKKKLLKLPEYISKSMQRSNISYHSNFESILITMDNTMGNSNKYIE